VACTRALLLGHARLNRLPVAASVAQEAEPPDGGERKRKEEERFVSVERRSNFAS
jgi:hypothetical protein